MTFKVGLDLGGTKIEGIVLNSDGKEVIRERIATEQEKGYEHILSRLRDLYRVLAEEIRGKAHTLGIGTPGAISHRTGLLKNSNTVCLNEKLSVQELAQVFGREPAIENDANCFAMAEALLGAGRGAQNVFGVIMGTGCGGGIVLDGKVLSGLQHIGGEWGHMSIDPIGPQCYCGQRGCVETLISGGGLQNLFEQEFGEKVTVQEIFTRFRSGDEKVKPFVETFFKNYGRALANLINILDPDTVVLGGGLSNLEELYARGYDCVKECVFSDSLETKIVKNELGDSAGVIGAALIGK